MELLGWPIAKEVSAMHIIVSLLLNVVRIAAIQPHASAPLAVIPRGDLLDVVFTMLPITTAVRQRLQEQSWSTDTPGSIGALLTTVVSSAHEIKACLTTPEQIAQAHAIEHHLAALLAMNHLADTVRSHHGTLTIDSLDLLRYVDRLYMIGSGSTPPTIVLGPSRLGHSERIRIPGSSYIAQRMTISYPGDTSYPRLNLRTPTASAFDDRPRQRESWVQKPRPSYNLAIYTHKDRLMGRVITKLVDTFPLVPDHSVRLMFAPQCQVRFLITEVQDEQETPIACCIKVIPALGQTA
jgi:hypothetical protein